MYLKNLVIFRKYSIHFAACQGLFHFNTRNPYSSEIIDKLVLLSSSEVVCDNSGSNH